MKPGTIRAGAVVLLSLAMGCASNQTPAGSPANAGSAAAPPSAQGATPGSSNAAPATPNGASAGPGAAGAAQGATAAAPGAAGAAGGGAADSTSAAAAAPKERPFAHTALEAQSLIQEQIEDHMAPLLKCVNDFRARKKDPHAAVVIDVGIDQEGNLLGITTPNIKKGDLDPAMRGCMMAALHGLPFPRSHAGIITVRQNFTDVVVQQ